MSLPSGTVTFLFTDIEGSTRLWEEHPKAMRRALARHDEAMRRTFDDADGHVFKTLGDSFCVAFETATDAVAAACHAQQALRDAGSDDICPLPVRMALYTGEAEARDDDYFGPALNRCARILAAAHGGQVLLSQTTTAGLVAEALPEGLTLESLGQHRLRDLVRPEELFQLAHPDLPADFPPLRSLAAFTHNLPAQVTDLIGREEAIAQVRERLAETRLLTLTGTGGAGKTRLALQVGAELLDAYPDGVWFIELASISDPSLVPQALVSTLGIREQPQKSLLETATDSLKGKRVLLILDNCEHLVDACAEVAGRALASCPDVQILATSREALRADGEVLWLVPSLDLPEVREGGGPSPSALSQSSAVRLFIERAKAVKSDFTVTDDNAPAVAQICHRLDGIPLAIELAAARMNVLSPEQIEERLDDRFRLLTGGRRTALPRQQTLRAAVEWSYDLLSEEERRLFERLSVFAGGFTLEAAEAVCAGDGIEEAEVLDLVGELVDKSLVVPQETEGGIRYRMPESLRAYGEKRLAAAATTDTARRAHADWFIGLAHRAGDKLKGPEQVEWLEVLAIDHDNLRATLAWTLDRDPDTASEVAVTLTPFWEVRCRLAEAREWLTRCLARHDRLRPESRAGVLIAAGGVARLQGDLGEAATLLEEGLQLSRSLGERRCIANALNNLGQLAIVCSEYARARTCHEESLAIRRALGDEAAAAWSLHNLGWVAHEQGDLATALAHYEESLRTTRRLGHISSVAFALNNIGNILLERGDHQQARRYHEEVLQIKRDLADKLGIAAALHNLGWAAHAQGDLETARAHYEESLRIKNELGEKLLAAMTLNNLGCMAQSEGDLEAAMRYHEEGLRMHREGGYEAGTARSLGNLGMVWLELNEHGRALELCQESLAICTRVGSRGGVVTALKQLGMVALGQAEHDAAREWFSRFMDAAREASSTPSLAEGLLWMARLEAATGNAARAARLFGAGETPWGDVQGSVSVTDLQEHQQAIAQLRAHMGDEAFDAAWAEGAAMTLEEAVEYALEGTESE